MRLEVNCVRERKEYDFVLTSVRETRELCDDGERDVDPMMEKSSNVPFAKHTVSISLLHSIEQIGDNDLSLCRNTKFFSANWSNGKHKISYFKLVAAVVDVDDEDEDVDEEGDDDEEEDGDESGKECDWQ